MTRVRAQAGLTLVEMLVAMGITVTLTGAVLALVGPSTAAFRAQPEVQDLQQRVRGAVDALLSDLSMAGAGMRVGPVSGPLHRYLAALRPYRIGEVLPDPAFGVFDRPGTMAVLHVPSSPAQTVVRRVALAGGTLLVDAESNCGEGPFDRLCGFQPGNRVLVFDRTGRTSIGTVSRVDGHTVHVTGAGVRDDIDVAEGAAMAEVVVRVYSLKPDAATGVPRLMQYDGRLTELPVIDHVVGLRFEYLGDPVPPRLLPGARLASTRGPWTTYGPVPPPVPDDRPDAWPPGENCAFAVLDGAHVPRLADLGGGPGVVPLAPASFADGPWCPDAAHPDRFDADLLRIRRARVVVRIEAAPPWLRGPAGPLFARGGTASAAEHRVPDVEIRFDVTPRNLNLEP